MLYVIAPSPDGPCKIGITNCPATRLRNMQVGNPAKLHILSVWTALRRKPRACERIVHCRLRHTHLRGEWFAVDQATAEAVIEREAGMLRVVSTPLVSTGYDYSYDRVSTDQNDRISWLIGPA